MTMCSGSLGFSDVDVLDKSIEPLLKGLVLRVRRHVEEEVAAPTRGATTRVSVLQLSLSLEYAKGDDQERVVGGSPKGQ
jgi:hypothetical protein